MFAKQLLSGRLFIDFDNYGPEYILIKHYTSDRKGKCVCYTVSDYINHKVFVYPNSTIKKVIV